MKSRKRTVTAYDETHVGFDGEVYVFAQARKCMREHTVVVYC